MYTPKSDSAARAPVQKKTTAEQGTSTALKSDLRQVGFSQGEAMLAPGGVQMKGGGGEDPNAVHQAAAAGIAGGGGALPHLAQIQHAFGRHDVGSVQSHTGGQATAAAEAMGASAYATGDHVAFGGGAPDLHTAAHEAAHVVQQRAGVSLSGGVGQSGDRYETHADQVADAVVQGKSAEGLLDQMAGGGGGGGRGQPGSAGPSIGGVQKKVVQREGEATKPGEKNETAEAPAEQQDWRTAIVNQAQQLTSKATLQQTDTGVKFGDSSLELARVHYCGQLGVPAEEPKAAPAADSGESESAGQESQEGGANTGAGAPAPAPAAAKPAAAPGKKGGDSEGKDLAGAPKWFNVMQNALILSGEWTTDQKVMQILVTAYLKASKGDVPANVAAFFDNAGKSEKNNQAKDLDKTADMDRYKGSQSERMAKAENWCQSASSAAFAQGLNNCGYFLKPRTIPEHKRQYFGGMTQISDQVGCAGLLASEINNFMPPDPNDKAKAKGSFSGVMDCWGAGVEPGDMVSFVSHSSSVGAAGHVVTIIACGGGDAQRQLDFVSGNAGSGEAGNGSIRAETATWAKPPGSIDVKKDRPPNAGEVWIWSITKLSKVTPNIIDETRKTDPGKVESFYKMTYDASKDKRVSAGS